VGDEDAPVPVVAGVGLRVAGDDVDRRVDVAALVFDPQVELEIGPVGPAGPLMKYGLEADRLAPVRWAPGASAGVNSKVTLPFWIMRTPGGPDCVPPSTSTMRPLTTAAGSGPATSSSTGSCIATAVSTFALGRAPLTVRSSNDCLVQATTRGTPPFVGRPLKPPPPTSSERI